jgi:hypothetical protein
MFYYKAEAEIAGITVKSYRQSESEYHFAVIANVADPIYEDGKIVGIERRMVATFHKSSLAAEKKSRAAKSFQAYRGGAKTDAFYAANPYEALIVKAQPITAAEYAPKNRTGFNV